jgi:integrase/recombinase XerC
MTDLIPLDQHELVSRAHSALDLAIVAWLDAKRGRSGSVHTGKIYATTLADFRAELQRGRLDLDADPRAVALAAQGWAGRNSPAPATFNRRLAVLSSFYSFARKRGLLELDNPIGQVERRPVQGYAGTEALRPADVRSKLASISRATLDGMRDYALLSVALATGRRVAEIAGLRWGHVHLDQDRVRLHFARAKGGKVMSDVLPAGPSRALTSYLAALYGASLGELANNAPIWVRLDRAAEGRSALSARSLENICQQRLGVNFHGLRHTFARTMEDAGAKVSEIQGRLGHSSLQTTGRYLAALRAAENPHAERVAELLGLE